MGARIDYIDSLLVGFETKTATEKQAIRAQIRAYKAGEHLAEYQALLPYAVNLGGGAKATILAAVLDNGNLRLEMEFRQGNTVLPFDNPWVIVNPPLLWPDPAGDVVRVGTDRNGNPVEERYREDLLAVGRDMIARMFARVVGQ